MNKIILGSAQLIKNYGISNSKATTKQNFFKLLDNCVKRGIKIIDTSDSYENAQEIIGKYKKCKFEIITKYYFKNKMNKKYYEKIIKKNLSNTKAAIGFHTLHAVLIHNIHQIDKNSLSLISNLLVQMKKKRLINKIGISIYNQEDLQKITNLKLIDILQVPINVLDRTFTKKKFLNKIKLHNIELHGRSIFLQGLLLMKPIQIKKRIKLPNYNIFKKWHSYTKKSLENKILTCLSFVLKIRQLDYCVIGFNSSNQLDKLMQLILKDKIYFKPSFKTQNKKIINPQNWNLI